MRQEDNSIITLCPSIGQFFINELPLLENIKSLDPLLYSKLTHQKNIRIK